MEVQIRMARLKKELRDYDRFIIYGAGSLAKILNAKLQENNLHADYCVISGNPNDDSTFGELPLFSFYDCIADLRKENTVVLIAVTKLYEKEIEGILIKNNVKNYIFAASFVDSITADKYFCITEQECLDELSEWYVEKNGMEFEDIDRIRRRLVCEKNKEPDDDKILFVVNNPSPRVVKITKALVKKNYQIEILFFMAASFRSSYCDELSEMCKDYHHCERIEELMYYALLSNAGVMHVFSNIEYSYVAKILIGIKGLFPRIVFEQYDISNKMYVEDKWSAPKNFEYERYCMEYADGVCFRGFEQDYLVENESFRISGKKIKFFDYCQDDVIAKNNGRRDSLRLCYAGGIATERQWAGASFACFLEFAKLCEANKCSFHLYPARWNDEFLEDYFKLDRDSDYFHLHRPIPYEKLKYELAQYDYGVHPVRKDYREKEVNGYYTKQKFIYAATNHYYDYLDAGIPIIAAFPEKFIEYFEAKRVLINWTIEEYDFDYLRKVKGIMRENVKKIQDELKISNNIDRLINFYQSIE